MLVVLQVVAALCIAHQTSLISSMDGVLQGLGAQGHTVYVQDQHAVCALLIFIEHLVHQSIERITMHHVTARIVVGEEGYAIAKLVYHQLLMVNYSCINLLIVGSDNYRAHNCSMVACKCATALSQLLYSVWRITLMLLGYQLM